MNKPISSCIDPEAVAARIRTKVSVDDNGCWNWHGVMDRNGYGHIRVKTPDGTRATGTHRAAWLSMVGDIESPELMIDHLCRNRACANPEHMELVTNQVNTLRADHSNKAGRSGRMAGSAPGCQKHGKSYGREKLGRDGYARWDCQTCSTERNRLWREAKKRAA